MSDSLKDVEKALRKFDEAVAAAAGSAEPGAAGDVGASGHTLAQQSEKLQGEEETRKNDALVSAGASAITSAEFPKNLDEGDIGTGVFSSTGVSGISPTEFPENVDEEVEVITGLLIPTESDIMGETGEYEPGLEDWDSYDEEESLFEINRAMQALKSIDDNIFSMLDNAPVVPNEEVEGDGEESPNDNGGESPNDNGGESPNDNGGEAARTFQWEPVGPEDLEDLEFENTLDSMATPNEPLYKFESFDSD